jgi:hypothetical protein
VASAAVAGHDREFSVGRVFGRGFGAIAAHPVMMLGLASSSARCRRWLPSPLRCSCFRAPARGILALTFLALVVDTVFAAATQGIVALAVVGHHEGRPADIPGTLPPALMRLVPLLLLGLIVGFGFAFGLVLLIVPGLMLYMAWWVAAPALVVERLGPFEALRRSASLTKNARWKVFGIELVLAVGTWVLD